MTLKPEHLAKQPKQERGWRKFETILAAANTIIVNQGVDELSVPKVATKAKVPLSSVYQFFPTNTAILVELASRHNQKLNEKLIEHMSTHKLEKWQDIFISMVDVTVAYSRANPVAQALFLSPLVPKEVMDISTEEDDKLNVEIISLLPKEVIDALLIAPNGISPIRVVIELILTMFALGFREQGEISDFAVAEAKRIGIGYLATFLKDYPIDLGT